MEYRPEEQCAAARTPAACLLIILTLLASASCGPDQGEQTATGSRQVPPGISRSTASTPVPSDLPPAAATRDGSTLEGLSDDADLVALFRQAAELARTGVYDRALELYLQILEQRPDHSPTLVNAARIHFIRGRTAEAIGLLERANLALPGHPRTLGYLGMAEAKAGRLEEARVHLELSQRIDPTRIDVCSELAGVYFLLERYDDAAEAWGKLLEQDPDNLPARAGLEQIRQVTEPAETGSPRP